MTMQTNSSSPFIDNATNVSKDLPVDTLKDFSIRTMHDDLLSLQKEEKPIETKVEIKAPQPIVETKKTITPITSSQIPVSKNISINKTPSNEVRIPEKSGLVEIPAPQKTNSNLGSLYKILLGAIVFFIVAIIGLVIYYFFLRNKTIVQTPVEVPVETPAQTEVPVVAPPAEKYSATMPNYLSFDPATETSIDLNKTLASIADELKNKNPQSIYEFTVVDSNNNPVLLPIFAAATKFNLSSSLLENLGENFSIFFYNDNGNIRLSFATTVKDKKIITTEMLKQEKTLVSDTTFLFIEPVPENKLVKFGASDYNGTPVRYFNFVLNNPGLSIDYIITDSNFVIGTSKNTARAIIDKILTNNTTPLNGQVLNNTSNTTQPSSSEKTILDCDKEDAACLLSFTKKLEDNLASCNISKGTAAIGWEPAFGIIRNYEITGIENNLCVVNYSFLKTTNVPESLLDSSMVCKYASSERTIQKVADSTNCSGPLYDKVTEFMAQTQNKPN